jgi:uncharacterized protein
MLSLTAVVAAPAWILASTFLTSLTGACVFAALDLTGRGNIAPDWQVGQLCGLGGLAGGYLGAMLQTLAPGSHTTSGDRGGMCQSRCQSTSQH